MIELATTKNCPNCKGKGAFEDALVQKGFPTTVKMAPAPSRPPGGPCGACDGTGRVLAGSITITELKKLLSSA
jgi:hypothetical protein